MATRLLRVAPTLMSSSSGRTTSLERISTTRSVGSSPWRPRRTYVPPISPCICRPPRPTRSPSWTILLPTSLTLLPVTVMTTRVSRILYSTLFSTVANAVGFTAYHTISSIRTDHQAQHLPVDVLPFLQRPPMIFTSTITRRVRRTRRGPSVTPLPPLSWTLTGANWRRSFGGSKKNVQV